MRKKILHEEREQKFQTSSNKMDVSNHENMDVKVRGLKIVWTLLYTNIVKIVGFSNIL